MLHPRKDYARIQDPAGLIPEDEPVFLLRAQDVAAAGVVRFWAESNMRMGGDPVLSSLAQNHASLMEAWPVKKLADLPAEQPAEQSAEPAAEPSAEPPAAGRIKPFTKPESKPGSGVVSEPTKSESKPDAGVVSEPEKSQNKPGSGVS